MKEFFITISSDLNGERLDRAVIQALKLSHPELPELSRGLIRKAIQAGSLYLNKKRCKISSKTVKTGDRIKIYLILDATTPKSWMTGKNSFPKERLLYEDEFLLVVNKPAPLPTQPTLDGLRANLFDELKKLLKAKDPEKKNPYLALIHRLDSETSGVILFSKSEKANKNLTHQFAHREVKKEYLAIVVGEIPESGQIEIALQRSDSKPMRMLPVKEGGKKSLTLFSRLETWTSQGIPYSLVKLQPQTGRTHQLRVHLDHLGYPIVGDPLYGKSHPLHQRIAPAPRLLLHAARISFSHPISANKLSFETSLPEDFIHFKSTNQT